MSFGHDGDDNIELVCQAPDCGRHVVITPTEARVIQKGTFTAKHELDGCHRLFSPVRDVMIEVRPVT